MKPSRSALRLPRYTLRRPVRPGTWGYFFNPLTWARKAGCPVRAEALGTDYAAAVGRAETVLLPAFDAWRAGGKTATPDTTVARMGTLDWPITEYRRDRRFSELSAKKRRNHATAFNLVGRYTLKDGRRLCDVRLSAIDAGVVDDLFERLLTVCTTDAAGNVVERERRTTVNDAMRSMRRAWNVAFRCHPTKVPAANPFNKMGLRSSNRPTPTASYAELQAFRTQARAMGYGSLATAALVGREWLQRSDST